MRSWLTLRSLATQLSQSRFTPRTNILYSTKASKPLRVLFCGSDEFSSESLRALHSEQQRNPKLISSIDVLCRPGKRSGRSMKQIREVPIKAVAQELGLPVHEKDTFRGWDLPKVRNESINLIIAVSFGLFVPPRILKSAEYGGLNVHPSLLPNFRGPAPLQHTLIAGEETIGVTLQTLDEKSFDHGVILTQTPMPGLPIPSADSCTYNDLLQFVKPLAADMLIEGLRNRVFVPPLVDAGHHDIKGLKHAPKITPQDRQIDWNWAPKTIIRRYHALGRLWTKGAMVSKRIIFEDFSACEKPSNSISQNENAEGINILKCVGIGGGGSEMVYENASDGSIICDVGDGVVRVRKITIEGQGSRNAVDAMRAWKREEEEFLGADYQV